MQIHLLRRAIKEAEAGCLLTERAAILREDHRRHSLSADAGAYGVKIVLKAILEKYTERRMEDVKA